MFVSGSRKPPAHWRTLVAHAVFGIVAGCAGASESKSASSSGTQDAGSLQSSGNSVDGAASANPGVVISQAYDAASSAIDAATTTCTASSTNLYPRPAEVLLVVDRSTTMAETIASDGDTRWSAMLDGIGLATSANPGNEAFGLMFFPKPSEVGNCCTMPADDQSPSIEVAPDVTAARAIASVLADSDASGVGAPTARALIQAANYLSARTTSTSKYVVLISGSEPTCPGDALCDDATSTDDTRAKETVTQIASVLGIKVGVVAIALPSSNNSLQPSSRQQLFIDLATLGGLRNTSQSQPAYYPAGTAPELETALDALATRMLSCTLALPTAVAWPDSVALSIHGDWISQDTTHQEGWDYGDHGASIVLYGKACDEAKATQGAGPFQFIASCPALPIF